MTKHLVLVAGNIGVGKTSLTERIGGRLGWRTAFESVVDNPYLSDFYANMQQWASFLQIFFLGHRARQHLELAACPESAIADRSIYEDAYIFVRVLHHMGNLSERDYQSYQALYELVMTTLPRLTCFSISAHRCRCSCSAFTAADGRWKAALRRLSFAVGHLLRGMDREFQPLPGTHDPKRGSRFRPQAETSGYCSSTYPG